MASRMADLKAAAVCLENKSFSGSTSMGPASVGRHAIGIRKNHLAYEPLGGPSVFHEKDRQMVKKFGVGWPAAHFPRNYQAWQRFLFEEMTPNPVCVYAGVSGFREDATQSAALGPARTFRYLGRGRQIRRSGNGKKALFT